MICTPEYGGYTAVLLELRHTAGDHDPAAAKGRFIVAAQLRKQLVHVLIISSLCDHGKLIAADAEHGAALKDITDDFAGSFRYWSPA